MTQHPDRGRSASRSGRAPMATDPMPAPSRTRASTRGLPPPDEPAMIDGHGGSMRRVLSLRNFRLLFYATATSLLGDQFALIATPWLVLQLTGDPFALGIVLAIEGLPRAAFMLIGGAATDRFSPRPVMLVCDVTRLVLSGAMAIVVLAGVVELWMLYTFALSFGVVAGFAVPAANSIVPSLVAEADLQAGNSLVMGVGQFAGFVGPSLAGVIIGGVSESMSGIALALGIDAVTFALSAACLWLIRGSGGRTKVTANESLGASIVAGFRHLWEDEALRLVFLVLVAVNFLVVGPLLVGIPVLAHERLPEAALAFGLIMGAFSIGNLVGYLLAGSLARPSGRGVRWILVGMLAAFGAVVGSVGFISTTWIDMALMSLLGLGNGYLAILLFTWLQVRTPRDHLGRLMGMITFASIGLVSASQAISGGIARWSIDALFMTAGALVLVVTVWTARQPGLVAFSDSLSEPESSTAGGFRPT